MFAKSQISLCCLYYRICSKEDDKLDFPGGSVLKNPPANAGDMGLIPVSRTKIPHATG